MEAEDAGEVGGGGWGGEHCRYSLEVEMGMWDLEGGFWWRLLVEDVTLWTSIYLGEASDDFGDDVLAKFGESIEGMCIMEGFRM